MANTNFTVKNSTCCELPCCLEAEKAVLGALLLNTDTLPTVTAILKPECFFQEQHKAIYSIILGAYSNGQNADISTVINEAVAAGVFETTDIAKAYLKAIMDGVPSASNIASYCRIVEEKYLIRSAVSASRVSPD